MIDTVIVSINTIWAVDNCVECPYWVVINCLSYCRKKEDIIIENTFTVPDWCPFRCVDFVGGHKK